MSFHSGFVCILGRPNAGKSTLLNALVGEKLAIISPKPQTTRNRILGIIEIPKRKGAGGQVVLIDTPGVHKPDSSLGRKMMAEVREALEGCILIFLIVDATRKFGQGDQFMLEMLKRSGTTAFLLLKKIGTAARLQIEKMLGTKVFLELFVKVRANWRESREFVDGLDWRRVLERLVGKAGIEE